MSEWKEIKLTEVISSISETFKFTDDPVIFLNTSDILDNKFLHSNLSDPKMLPGQAKKRIKKGDFLFSEIRPANKRFAIVNFDAENYVVSTKLMVLRANEKINVNFLKYFLTNEEQLEYLQTLAEDRSGTFPQITFEILGGLEINLPPLSEQKAIADVLSALDDKIDLLHRQNHTLEQMAETLFRQWFVEKAQEDWEEFCVSDIAIHKKDSINPAKFPTNLFYHFSLPAFDSGRRVGKELGLEILSSKYKISHRSILVSKLNPQTPRIWLVLNSQINYICSTEFQNLMPKNTDNLGFLYCLFKSKEVIDELAMGASGTSGSHQRIKPQDMLNIKFKSKNLEYLTDFSSVVEPFLLKVESNLKQIQTLETLRDTLLPKLISGEVRVNVQAA